MNEEGSPGAPAGDDALSPPPWRLAARDKSWLLKPLVALLLYGIILYTIDVGALAARLRSTRLEYLAAAVLLYVLGQMSSSFRWYLLLRPVNLVVPFWRLTGFYFIGMFFNIFLPTVVGGDAVKAVLLARETRAPVRATTAVFMERDLGLFALLTIAMVAAWSAPPMELFGFGLPVLLVALFALFVGANLLIFTAPAYHVADRLVTLTPLARLRPRASSLHEAILPYMRDWRVMIEALAVSFVFQFVVIVVVFLNARALGQSFPMSAMAVFVPLISLAGMIPVSINGLGVREALYLLLFGRLGASSDVALSLALLYFAVTVVASLPGGIVYAIQKRSPADSPPTRFGGTFA